MNSIKEQINSLTEVEQDRLIEIDFYMFIKHLLDSYNHSVLSTDVVESLAQLYNCNVTLLKKITNEIYAGNSCIIPSKKELVIMLYKSGVALREIRRMTGVHPQTVYRYLDEYKLEGQFEYMYRLEEEELVILKSFMLQLKQLLDWRK